MNCAVLGCQRPRTQRGHFCNSHRSHQRRHGHAQQEGITSAALRPYLKLINEHIKRNAGNPAWVQLDQYWRDLVEGCVQELEALRDRPAVRWHRRALQQVAAMKDIVEAREVVTTILALYALAEFEPRRFRSDQSFRFQLVRVVRRLAPVHVGSYYDQQSRRTKRVYRDLPPKVTAAIAEHLISTFGASGLHVAALEVNRKTRQKEAKEEFGKALADLK